MSAWRQALSAWRTTWDRLSLYLPIVLMGLLALGTYWLVRSTPDFSPPSIPQAPRNEPDFTMKNFSVKAFDAAGRLKSEVSGAESRHYPDNGRIEITSVRIRSHRADGQPTTATANTAITNADGNQVQLVGNALVVRDAGQDPRANPRLGFAGERLHADLEKETVRADSPVQLTRGTDTFTADSLALDNVGQVLELRGRVRGTIGPGAAAASPPAPPRADAQ
jgi:lipopolysaccharide export system protein LptC